MELLKLIVQPVLIERDDDGAIVGERLLEPIACYTTDQLLELFERIAAELAG